MSIDLAIPELEVGAKVGARLSFLLETPYLELASVEEHVRLSLRKELVFIMDK